MIPSTHGPERRRRPTLPTPGRVGGAVGARVDSAERRKIAIILGVSAARDALYGAVHPEAPDQTLPRAGYERVTALQLALESLLFAHLLAPGLAARACVAVAIQAVRLAAWVMWWRAKRNNGGRE